MKKKDVGFGAMAKSIRTAYGNLMVAIDIETTGEIVGEHEMYQLSILPLDQRLEPDKTKIFLNLFIKPDNPKVKDGDNSGLRARFVQARLHGLAKHQALVVLEKWADTLEIRRPGLMKDRQLMPICFNWAWKRAFLIDFMGPDFFHDLFHWNTREIITAAAFCNDRRVFRGEDPDFGKLTLPALSRKLEVVNPYPDDPAFDTRHFADIYQALMLHPLGEIR